MIQPQVFPRQYYAKKANYELYEITRKPQRMKLELIIGDLQNLDVHIDDSKMMTHIQLNLLEEYQTIIGIL